MVETGTHPIPQVNLPKIDFSQLKTIGKRVIKLLEKYPEFRDDDEMLVTKYWWEEMKSIPFYPEAENSALRNPKETMFKDFIELYRQGKITPADLITRARREVQKKNPRLRGEKWEERHGILTSQAKGAIKNTGITEGTNQSNGGTEPAGQLG